MKYYIGLFTVLLNIFSFNNLKSNTTNFYYSNNKTTNIKYNDNFNHILLIYFLR